MNNPNNTWVYNYPLPPGYTPPPPQAPKSTLTPPAGKNPGLALAMVCVMALTALVAAVVPFLNGPSLIDSVLSSPVYLALVAANLLMTLLVFLQFVLPGWEPRRKILGWLLGVSLLCTLALTIYGVVQGMQIGLSAADDILGDPAVSGFANIFTIVISVVGALVVIAMSPFFYLLLGIWTKKSMEKVAGVFAAISLGSTVLFTPLGLLLTSLTAGAFELPATLWTTTLPSLASSVCAVIFYFTWPVMERPVLEKSDPTSSGL